MKYIDTHAHLNLAAFDTDRDLVAGRCRDDGVAMINIGTHQTTSQLAVDLANQYDHMHAIVGLHPINVLSPDSDEETSVVESEFDRSFYEPLAKDARTVGVGECGFDYCHNSEDSYATQRDVFLAQVDLANQVNKPLMLHLRNVREGGQRDAYDDALDILASEAKVPGNSHFYAGTIEQMRRFFELGYTVSFTGVVTFAGMYKELIEYAPLDMMHVETDCPYVAPVPYRGGRCEPWMVTEVVKKIAKVKKLDEEVVQEQLLLNAERLYGISTQS